MRDAGEEPEAEEESTGGNVYKQVLGLRVVQLLALFILAYVGVETTIGGETFTERLGSVDADDV